MAAKRPKPKPGSRPAAGRLTMAATVAKSLLAVGLVAAVVAAVVWLGGRAGQQVADNPRYAVRFADIQCDAPPGADRSAFLAEVRPLGPFAETVQVVDPELPAALAAGFGQHPWVESVSGITVTADRQLRVNLVFRTPALVVKVIGEKEMRVVDRHAVLLPLTASADGLPVLSPPVFAPATPAGRLWDDPLVRRAVELAEMHRDRKLTKVERIDKGWRLTPAAGKPLLVGW
jgi:hypothetical protein